MRPGGQDVGKAEICFVVDDSFRCHGEILTLGSTPAYPGAATCLFPTSPACGGAFSALTDRSVRAVAIKDLLSKVSEGASEARVSRSRAQTDFAYLFVC